MSFVGMLGACGSSSAPSGPVTGCAALSACCSAPKLPASDVTSCSSTVDEADDDTCDELFTEYEIDGYCGSIDIMVYDAGDAALSADCTELEVCCSQATFTGNASDCETATYSGDAQTCYTALSSYASSGACGNAFDAGMIPAP